MRYLVIGLGTYGRNLAINLTLLGNEVIGVDNKQNNLEAVKRQIEFCLHDGLLGEELLEYASVEKYRYSHCGDRRGFPFKSAGGRSF